MCGGFADQTPDVFFQLAARAGRERDCDQLLRGVRHLYTANRNHHQVMTCSLVFLERQTKVQDALQGKFMVWTCVYL